MQDEKALITLYCRICKKSLHVSHVITGNPETLVLPNVCIKCKACKRVIFLKKMTEKQLIEGSVHGKYFI